MLHDDGFCSLPASSSSKRTVPSLKWQRQRWQQQTTAETNPAIIGQEFKRSHTFSLSQHLSIFQTPSLTPSLTLSLYFSVSPNGTTLLSGLCQLFGIGNNLIWVCVGGCAGRYWHIKRDRFGNQFLIDWQVKLSKTNYCRLAIESEKESGNATAAATIVIYDQCACLRHRKESSRTGGDVPEQQTYIRICIDSPIWRMKALLLLPTSYLSWVVSGQQPGKAGSRWMAAIMSVHTFSVCVRLGPNYGCTNSGAAQIQLSIRKFNWIYCLSTGYE